MWFSFFCRRSASPLFDHKDHCLLTVSGFILIFSPLLLFVSSAWSASPVSHYPPPLCVLLDASGSAALSSCFFLLIVSLCFPRLWTRIGFSFLVRTSSDLFDLLDSMCLVLTFVCLCRLCRIIQWTPSVLCRHLGPAPCLPPYPTNRLETWNDIISQHIPTPQLIYWI